MQEIAPKIELNSMCKTHIIPPINIVLIFNKIYPQFVLTCSCRLSHSLFDIIEHDSEVIKGLHKMNENYEENSYSPSLV